MDLNQLESLSPIDGRYAKQCNELRPFFSEKGLIFYRLTVEIHWLIKLSETKEIEEIKNFSSEEKEFLLNLLDSFSVKETQIIKNIEKTTNHDVKAVEYYIKEKLLSHPTLNQHIPFIHFACTSEDINNLAYALMLKNTASAVIQPSLASCIQSITELAEKCGDQPMLSRTHGQAASPTTMSKELVNVIARLQRQQSQLENMEILGKINGAVGNFNAHSIAYPEINWPELSQTFIASLGLSPNLYTTQIEPHDNLAEFFHCLIRINNILIDFSRDIWGYISLDYFKQQLVETEVGSSTMPHKINPIQFENAEGNLGLSSAILEHLANKLTISRWQRDLSDSTALRNIGTGLAHQLIAFKALNKGLQKLRINENKLNEDLDNNWNILGEAVQTLMRKQGETNAYEQLKELTRGKQLDPQSYEKLLETVNLPAEDKAKLRKLSPQTYIGIASELSHSI